MSTGSDPAHHEPQAVQEDLRQLQPADHQGDVVRRQTGGGSGRLQGGLGGTTGLQTTSQ